MDKPSIRVALAGHLWTIGPSLRHRLAPRRAPPGAPWTTDVIDPTRGAIRLTGSLSTDPQCEDILVVVHGLGGSIESQYMIRAAAVARRAGLACLRLSLRGADRSGEDYYHAGLVDDLHAAVASPSFAGFRRVYILGYSLGGHVTLAFGLPDGYGGLVRPGAALRRDPRVRAVASVCAPLDLASSSAAIDQPSGFVYRGHVLDGLREIYAEVARRRPVPAPLAAVREIKTIREWDRRVIVPRHGFRDEHDYYQRVSVGPHLSGLELPTLIVSTTGDPMIPVHTVAPSLRDLPDHVLTRWVRGGGHVGYPGASDLGFGPVYGVESQIVAWMQRHR